MDDLSSPLEMGRQVMIYRLQSILLHFYWKEIKFLFVHLNHG
jgi:hypothetical protein